MSDKYLEVKVIQQGRTGIIRLPRKFVGKTFMVFPHKLKKAIDNLFKQNARKMP